MVPNLFVLLFMDILVEFFMPWFFFKAGMFFKQRTLTEEIHKSFKRLLVPYIYFTVLGTCILWIKQFIYHEFTFRSILSPVTSILKAGSVPGNLALWFLLSLFCVRIIFNFINSKIIFANSSWGKCLWGVVFSVNLLRFFTYPLHI